MTYRDGPRTHDYVAVCLGTATGWDLWKKFSERLYIGLNRTMACTQVHRAWLFRCLGVTYFEIRMNHR